MGRLVDLRALDHQEEAFLAGELGEHLCGEEGRGAVLSVCMHGTPSSRASSEITCTAEIAISLKLGTWDAVSGHLRSISHGMFDSLKRPVRGERVVVSTCMPRGSSEGHV